MATKWDSLFSPQDITNGVSKIILKACDLSGEDIYAALDSYIAKTNIKKELSFSIYQLFTRIRKVADEAKKIALIDKYMRMLFNAVVFTKQKNLPLLSIPEREILRNKMSGISSHTSTELSDSKMYYSDHADEYIKKSDIKNSFNDINCIGIFTKETNEYLLCFADSEIKTDTLMLCLILICLAYGDQI